MGNARPHLAGLEVPDERLALVPRRREQPFVVVEVHGPDEVLGIDLEVPVGPRQESKPVAQGLLGALGTCDPHRLDRKENAELEPIEALLVVHQERPPDLVLLPGLEREHLLARHVGLASEPFRQLQARLALRKGVIGQSGETAGGDDRAGDREPAQPAPAPQRSSPLLPLQQLFGADGGTPGEDTLDVVHELEQRRRRR